MGAAAPQQDTLFQQLNVAADSLFALASHAPHSAKEEADTGSDLSSTLVPVFLILFSASSSHPDLCNDWS